MSGPLSTTLIKSIGGTENTPHPFRWVVNTHENLASVIEPTLKATDLHKLALITSTGGTFRLTSVSPAQWSPISAKDLELASQVAALNLLKTNGYDLEVNHVTNGIIDLNAGQAFKITETDERVLSITNDNVAGRMKTVAILIEGNSAVTWPESIKWSGETAPVLGNSYTLIVLAIFESSLSGHVASSV